jgi:hypothetical protein
MGHTTWHDLFTKEGTGRSPPRDLQIDVPRPSSFESLVSLARALTFMPGHPNGDRCTVTDHVTGSFAPISIRKLVGTIQKASVMMTSSSYHDKIRNCDNKIIAGDLAWMAKSAIGEPNHEGTDKNKQMWQKSSDRKTQVLILQKRAKENNYVTHSTLVLGLTLYSFD